MSYQPGLDIHPGPDEPTPQPGVTQPSVDTPDPFATADQTSYDDSTVQGVDVGIAYRPPWPMTRAPGTVATIVAGEIIPIDPWQPVIALLNGDQLAMLNTRSAARQAAAYWVDDPRQV